ncbi:MAG: hypothetical protein L0922_07100, partial [Candidatus Mariimomonas ferrooxydans]
DGLNCWTRRSILFYGGMESKNMLTTIGQIRKGWPQEEGGITTLCPECNEKRYRKIVGEE